MFTNKGGKRMILDIVGKEQFREKIRENNPELKKKYRERLKKYIMSRCDACHSQNSTVFFVTGTEKRMRRTIFRCWSV